jgi:glycolate oxidase iron-sulfur subunit
MTPYGLPFFKGAPYLDSLEERHEAIGREVGRVALIIGCSGNFTAPWAVDSAISLLRTAGWTVLIPRQQRCCGAPAINNGQWELARKLAIDNLTMLDGLEVDAITSPDATCAAAIKYDYNNLNLADDLTRNRLERISGKTTELSQLLGRALDEGRLKFQPFKVSATVHDSCHSTHLGSMNRWRDLIRAIPGVDLREMSNSKLCCGFGGSYAVMHRESSDRIARRKMYDGASTGAEIMLVGSPGCQIRLQSIDVPEHNLPQVRLAVELLAGMAV